MNLSVGSSIEDMGKSVSGVCIKLAESVWSPPFAMCIEPYLVIRSSIDFGSRMNVGRVILLRSAPGRSCDIIDRRTTSIRIMHF